MPPRLVSLDGHADVPLDRLLVVVGRHRQCDVQIDSLRVSRRHCCLALDSDGVLVRDLGSRNGTWINGVRSDEGLLRPGDELMIAHLRYSLKLHGPGEGPADDAARRPQMTDAVSETLSAEPPILDAARSSRREPG